MRELAQTASVLMVEGRYRRRPICHRNGPDRIACEGERQLREAGLPVLASTWTSVYSTDNQSEEHLIGIRGTTMKRHHLACAVLLGATALLAGCGDRVVSGTYVEHGANDSALLQITETPDHRFTGTLRHAALSSNGTVSTSSANVSGSVDNGTIVMTIQETPLPIGKNISGTISGHALDFSIPSSQGTQTGIAHFEKADVGDFDAAVAKLSQAGAPIIAARQRAEQAEQLDRQVNALTRDINSFVQRAQHVIDQTPGVVAYYTKSVYVEQSRLNSAQQLAASRNNLERGQANLIVGQINLERNQVLQADASVDRTQQDAASGEATLNAAVARWSATCLDGKDVKPSDVIPNMGPCRSLASAVASYRAILPKLQTALATAGNAKVHAGEQLARIWRSASNLQ